jgi:hypothetical protein
MGKRNEEILVEMNEQQVPICRMCVTCQLFPALSYLRDIIIVASGAV